ncbi:LanC-like protein 2 [Galdieria sulphuraria]|nr:LanC-like protein 2 [Galdieria sulphuraria]
MERRCFSSPVDDFEDSEFIHFILKGDWKQAIQTKFGKHTYESIQSIAQIVQHRVKPEDARKDPTVYTGTAGIAYFFYRLGIHPLLEPNQRLNYLAVAKKYSDASVNIVENNTRRLGTLSTFFYSKVISLTDSWLTTDSEDEFLYGKAGFLTALMFFHGYDKKWEICARNIAMQLFENGRKTANSSNWSRHCPLLYQWHNKFYLGAAHDFQCFPENELKETCEFLYRQRCPRTNNYFSSLDSRRSELVQWCHGAPGFVYLFCKAAEHFSDITYLKHALEASIPVWNCGLLLKGPGLCHGIAGNAYCFLRLFRCLQQFPSDAQKEKLLFQCIQRAAQMGSFLINYSTNSIPCIHTERGMRTPDRPFSLYEVTFHYLIEET